MTNIDVPQAGSYRVDPMQSTVTFRTRHLFGLAAVAGTTQITAGEIAVDPGAATASVAVTINAASFNTGNERRDTDTRGVKFLDVQRFPELSFRAGDLTRTGSGWDLAGQLTVRGESRPVTLAITSLRKVSTGFRANATTRIDRYAFGLTAAKGMAARFVDVDLNVLAEPTQVRPGIPAGR